MERTKKTEEITEEAEAEAVVQPKIEPVGEKRVRYRKLGGGSLHLKTRLIKPNEVFWAFPSEISAAFKDVVVPVDGLPEVPSVPDVVAVKTIYEVKPRGKSRSMFDVIGPMNKVINEKPLSKEIAEQLKADLER